MRSLILGQGGPNTGSLDCPPEAPSIGTCDVCRDPIYDAIAWRINFGDGRKAQTGCMECVRDLWICDMRCQIETQGISAVADGQLAEINKIDPCRDCGLIAPCGCR